MFLKQQLTEAYTGITEKIKKDLAATLLKKGVEVCRIQIDMKPDKMNLEVYINDKRYPEYINSR
ncbi:MAG TPA: metal-dependent phosphohydrolase [Clostridiaceae bacterium]|nr:metal-dependent phosphohydrolase [Clostridiaceae bacterium]